MIYFMGFFYSVFSEWRWLSDSAMGTKRGLYFDDIKDKVSKTKESYCVEEGRFILVFRCC